jgi:predicted phage gp36 major capsid-like protein
MRSTSGNGSAAASAFRRKSCSGEQSLLSVTIDEADTDAENVDEKTILINHVAGSTSSAAPGASGANADSDVRTGSALSERYGRLLF